MWTRYPKWNFKPYTKSEKELEVLDNKQQLDKEFRDTIMDAINSKTTASTVPRDKKCYFKYKTPCRSEEETEVYNNYLSLNPRKHIGPQHYWKYPKVPIGKKKPKEPIPQVIEDENGGKTWYSKRETTDKRVYKPMKKHLF